MKLKNIFTILTVAIFATVFSFSVVLAERDGSDEKRAEVGQVRVTDTSERLDDSDEQDGEDDDRLSQGSTTLRFKNQDRNKNKDRGGDEIKATSTEKFDDEGKGDDDGDNEGDRQEKKMKRIFKGLNDISREAPGLGDEIREIARNEASSTEERVAAIHEIQRQGFLSRIFFGANKGRIDSLNKELKTTQKSIDRLEIAKTKIASSTIGAEIDVQIKALETARTSAEAFIKNNESAFSIFGFFSKIFGGK